LTPEEAEALREQRREAARLRREAELAMPVDRSKRMSTQQRTEASVVVFPSTACCVIVLGASRLGSGLADVHFSRELSGSAASSGHE
jgi:aromatic ring hydroxylase